MLFIFLLLSLKISLYIPYMSLRFCIIHICSHYLCCLFTFLIVTLKHKRFKFWLSTIYLFFFYFVAFLWVLYLRNQRNDKDLHQYFLIRKTIINFFIFSHKNTWECYKIISFISSFGPFLVNFMYGVKEGSNVNFLCGYPVVTTLFFEKPFPFPLNLSWHSFLKSVNHSIAI